MERWRRAWPDDTDALLGQASLAYRRGAYGFALRLMDEVLAKDPDNETAATVRTKALKRIGWVGTPKKAVPVDVYLKTPPGPRSLTLSCVENIAK